MLADYCLTRLPRLPSAALVELAGEFGISPMGARAALSRLARRGVVEHSKRGRRTYYRLARPAAEVLVGGSRRIVAFADDSDRWDGEWTVVAFSIPEEHRETRHMLRSRLRWHGFAPLYDGLWVSPNASADEASAIMAELSVTTVSVLRARSAASGPGTRDPIEAWDLAPIAAEYEAFIERWTPIVADLRSGTVNASAALVARTEIMDTYRRFPGLDPQLPLYRMPEGWPRLRARALFTEAYDWLGPLAVVRVRQLVSQTDPDTAALIEHHTTSDLLAERVRVGG